VGNTQLNRCFGDLRQVEATVHIYAPTLRGIQLNLLSTATHRSTVLIRRIDCLARARKALWKQLARRKRKQYMIVNKKPTGLYHYDPGGGAS
jgi:hypothetical protein